MAKHRDITDRLESAAAHIAEHSGSNLYAKLMKEASEIIVQLRSQAAELASKVSSIDIDKHHGNQ